MAFLFICYYSQIFMILLFLSGFFYDKHQTIEMNQKVDLSLVLKFTEWTYLSKHIYQNIFIKTYLSKHIYQNIFINAKQQKVNIRSS